MSDKTASIANRTATYSSLEDMSARIREHRSAFDFAGQDLARRILENPATLALREVPEYGSIARMLEDTDRGSSMLRAALGPMDDLQRAGGLFDEQSEVFRAMAKAQEIIESYKTRFVLPANDSIGRIIEQLRSDPVREALARYATHAAEAQRAIEAMRAPWLNSGDHLRSITALAEIQGIGNIVTHFPTFELKVGTALRVDLGDWRDEITFPDAIYADLGARVDFYAGLGFDTALTDLPAEAFEESTEIAGLRQQPPTIVDIFGQPIQAAANPDEEAALVRTNVAHDWLLRLETRLRFFINTRMTAVFGENWPRGQLPNGLYEKWVEKRERAIKSGRNALHLIEYADFTDYREIISRDDNWKQVFVSVFHRKEDVRESFQRLFMIRIDTMHARPICQDDELLLFVEVKRIVQAIMA